MLKKIIDIVNIAKWYLKNVPNLFKLSCQSMA